MRSVVLVGVFVLFALVALAGSAEATHFRWGILSWEPTENPLEVKFTGNHGWRASAFGSPAVGSIIVDEGSLCFGDGFCDTIYLKVTTYNFANDYLLGQFVRADGTPGVLHTYATPDNNGQPWVVSWGSCCRISSVSSGNYHVNNPDQSERLETLVSLATPNASPKTLLPPINPCEYGTVCLIDVPVVDADADAVTFRLSTSGEAGDFGYAPPGPPDAPNAATIGASSGVITWDTASATYDPGLRTLYSMQVMVEDGSTKTPIDFFIELVPPGTVPPHWVIPPTPCGQTLFAAADATLTFPVEAASADTARTVRIDHLGLPAGATFPLPSPANPVGGTFSWTPTLSDAGEHLVVFTAEDDRGRSPPTCVVRILVNTHPAPTFIPLGPCATREIVHVVETFPLTFPVNANSTNLSRTVTLALVSGPAGLTFAPGAAGNPTTGTASWASAVLGTHTARFSATDSQGLVAFCNVRIVVDPYPPPVFVAPSPCALGTTVYGIEGVSLTFPLAATSLSRDVTITQIGGPVDATLDALVGNPATGTLTWPSPLAGGWTFTFRATDTHGLTDDCTVLVDIADLTGQASAKDAWVGLGVPATAEYDSHEATKVGPGSEGPFRAVTVRNANFEADGVEVSASVAAENGTATSRATTQIAEVRLLGGRLVIEALEQDAVLVWDAANATSTLVTTPTLGRITFDGAPVPVLAGEATTVPIPGGRLVLFEQSLVDGEDVATYRENLVHLYAGEAYGRAEVIVGSVVLQAGVVTEYAHQERAILAPDDARSGRDAPAARDEALPVATGVIDARFDAAGDVDVYAIAVKHGEKVTATLQPAATIRGQRGAATVTGVPPSAALPTSTQSLGPFATLRLYDPTGAVRESDGPLLVAGEPIRVELNADQDGVWAVEAVGQSGNYSLAFSVTPLVLLDQSDALSGADAGDACDASNVPLVSTGVWPGVLRDNDFVDVYRFEANIGEFITIAVKPGEDVDGFDATIQLLDRDCSLVDEIDVSDGADLKGTPAAALDVPARYTGDYYAKVIRVNGIGNTYLVVDVQNPQPTLPNNDALTGADAPAPSEGTHTTPLAPVFQGRLTDDDEGDTYGLTFAATQRAMVAFSMSALSDANVRLVGPAGEVLPIESAASQIVWEFKPAQAGLYRLEITRSFAGGNYLVAFGQSPVDDGRTLPVLG